MTITVTSVQVGPAQKDGRCWIVETYGYAQGACFINRYLGDSAQASAVASARLALVEDWLQQGELLSRLALDANPMPLRYQAGGAFLDRLRAYYRTLEREDAARVARWITRRLDAGDVTVAQLRAAWGLTLTQWNALETRLRNLRGAIESVDAAAGE